MHPATFAAFQDELEKIAKLFTGTAAEWDALRHGSRDAAEKKVLQEADKLEARLPPKMDSHSTQHAPAASGAGGGTAVVPAPSGPAPGAKKLEFQAEPLSHHPTPAATGIEKTQIRAGTSPAIPSKMPHAGTVAGHSPAAVPHPAAVPGGGAGLLRRGASLARAHAAPLAVGAGVATMGAMALSKMRQKNAPSR